MRTCIVFVLLLSACTRSSEGPDTARPQDNLEQLLSHPVRQASFWREQLSVPLEGRILPAAPQVIDYVLKDNAYNGYPDQPTSSTATPAFIADVRAAVQSLHPRAKELIAGSLVGIGLVESFGASAYTEGVFGKDGKTMGGFILLDVGALSRTANEWASWKERSPFAPSDGWSLEARIEEPKDDTRANAIRYILMHELGHVVDFSRGITPFVGLAFNDPIGWSKLSWQQHSDGKAMSRFDRAFQERPKLRYYAFNDSTFSLARGGEIYAWLSATSFPTLYAATSKADDFAEAFASYAHVVLDQRPWEVTVHKADGQSIHYWPCWAQPRCADKEKVLSELFRSDTVAR